MNLTVQVAGVPLADHSPPTYADAADGGCEVASWMVPVGRTSRVEEGLDSVIFGPAGLPVWSGLVESFDRATGGVRGRGHWHRAAKLPALTAEGGMTLSVADAVVRGRALGWRVESGGVSGTAAGTVTAPLTVAQVLEMYATESGARVGVDASRTVFLRPIRTDPQWIIAVPDVKLSGTDLGRSNALAIRFYNEAGVLSTTYRPWPLPAVTNMKTWDLTGGSDARKMSAAQAQAYGDAALARLLPDKPTWTGGLEVDLSQIRRFGGGRVTSWTSVSAGDVVRVQGFSAAHYSRVGASYVDVELGRLVVTGGSSRAILEPTGTLPTSLEDAMQAVRAA